MASERAGPDHDGRTADDDQEAARKIAEPIILEGVASELAKRGLTAATGQPDLIVTYYLLLTSGVNAQTVGQFLSATPEWGLPPFPPGHTVAQSHERRVARDRFQRQGRHRLARRRPGGARYGIDPKKREAVLREGDHGICCKRFPPK